MTRTIHGTAHGRIIELDEDIGLVEGQLSRSRWRTVASPQTRPPGEGFLRTEGALADDPHWERHHGRDSPGAEARAANPAGGAIGCLSRREWATWPSP